MLQSIFTSYFIGSMAIFIKLPKKRFLVVDPKNIDEIPYAKNLPETDEVKIMRVK